VLIDARVYDDVTWIARRYRLRVTAAREGGHRRHGDELRAEIAMQRTALHLADEELAQPLLPRTSPLAPANRHRAALARDRTRQLCLQREAPARARALGRERGLELEL